MSLLAIIAQGVPGFPRDDAEWVLKTGGIAGLCMIFAFVAFGVAWWALRRSFRSEAARLEDANAHASKQESLLREQITMANTYKETAVQSQAALDRAEQTIKANTEVVRALGGSRGA